MPVRTRFRVSRERKPLHISSGSCFSCHEGSGMDRMRGAVTVAVWAAFLLVLNGRVEAAETCITKATAALPRLEGLVIKKSRTRPVSPAILSTWKGQARPIIVDVDFEAAGEAQTYSYMCVITQGSAFVQRTMN
jgi:hypothetical protein